MKTNTTTFQSSNVKTKPNPKRRAMTMNDKPSTPTTTTEDELRLHEREDHRQDSRHPWLTRSPKIIIHTDKVLFIHPI